MSSAPWRAPRILLGLATAIVLLPAALSPAYAHDELVKVTPSTETALVQAPQEITLTYSGEIMDVDGANQVRVEDSAGNNLAQGQPEIEGKDLTQALVPSQASNETYTVTWRVVSSDGHPIQGSYQLTIGEGKTASAQASQSQDQEPTADQSEDTSAEKTGTLGKVALFGAGLVALLALGITLILKSRRSH